MFELLISLLLDDENKGNLICTDFLDGMHSNSKVVNFTDSSILINWLVRDYKVKREFEFILGRWNECVPSFLIFRSDSYLEIALRLKPEHRSSKTSKKSV
jgi:hypothetical protein